MNYFGYYENIGTSTNAIFVFRSQTWENIILRSYYSTPFFTDIDSDGDADLFIGCEDGGVYYYHNTAADTVFPVIDISINGNDVVLSWAGFTFAEAYQIYYQDTPYFTPVGIPQAIVTPPDTSWTDEGAVTMGKRWYRVVVEY
jgi:hypothetical protein